ncbi:ATP-binding cassette domain-containing protein [Homoserinibacter sp. YIM 151385]|uniref:ATP-binding cassette domain-containing protein n=1 Tax=Homoserinibacter sp. YIM 151385 TaxID=2985506 RepID=UPI0022F0E5EC|nr:ATP-binding cassette domain-containing protein [Homoserinibacter sp. YIM 151385]WBU38251.1 ATP-binding cassette domain-containing protein [Homoserinibacter sp. YIM 151385]
MQGATIEFDRLTKRFGGVDAVQELSFRVEPGVVTGFLGPNGAGKTTSLRSLLGLVRPTSGRATFDGRRYAELERPLATVGTALEASSFHAGRTGREHLRVVAAAAGIPGRRAEEVLEQVGLGQAGRRRVGGYSLGMRQRLGLAVALLGDPGVLVLDEPINGLDPEGIRWIRGLLRGFAADGRTVLVSSHLLSEVQQTVDRVVVIAKGRLAYQGALEGLGGGEPRVRVDSPDRGALIRALGSAATPAPDGRGLLVDGLGSDEVGGLAYAAGVQLSHLAPEGQVLEDRFLALVGGAASGEEVAR